MSYNQPPEYEVGMAAAMVLCPTVRSWAVSMGVMGSAFTHDDCRAVYEVMLGNGSFDAPQLKEVRERPFTGPHMSLWRNIEDAVLHYSAPCWTDNHGLLMEFQRGAHKTFKRWGVPVLKWATKMLEDGAEGRVVKRASEVLAFAAFDRRDEGVWIYNPGKELLVKWDSYTGVE